MIITLTANPSHDRTVTLTQPLSRGSVQRAASVISQAGGKGVNISRASVAAGVPSARADHARALALMALDMVDAIRSSDELGHLDVELRIGINSGPVVAGVIGRKRFLYDLWGDAVNTASRMESHGTPGRIQITRATYDLIEDEFVCEPRGTISIKGKGDMETWYLLERRAPAEMGAAGGDAASLGTPR